MSDLDRITEWFEAGTLLRPDYLCPSTVSLSHALASLGGTGLALDEPARRICTAIGETEHLILVLADGLGMNLVEGLPATSFLRRHLAFEMRSVFPSSTAPALTSLASGLWPAEHGLLGWFVYLPEQRVQAIALPFRERFTSRSLADLGLGGDDVFVWPSLLAGYQRDARLLMPRNIIDSIYTRSISGGVDVQGYRSLRQGIDLLIASLKASALPTYTYFYYPNIDTAAHSHGPSDPAVRVQVDVLDKALERLAEGVEGSARIVVSSDHGGIDVDARRKVILDPRSPVAELLKTPPSGEPRAPIFHVRAGAGDEFAAAFRQEFGEQFALLTAEEVFELQVLGPKEASAVARARMGDFMAFSAGREALIYAVDQGMVQMMGFHGGLDGDEVRIPLIVG